MRMEREWIEEYYSSRCSAEAVWTVPWSMLKKGVGSLSRLSAAFDTCCNCMALTSVLDPMS